MNQPSIYNRRGCSPRAALLADDRKHAEAYARMLAKESWPGLAALAARCERRVRENAARIIAEGCEA